MELIERGATRHFSMPSGNTFSMKPVRDFIDQWANRSGLVVDPFARNSTLADLRNDLDPSTAASLHMDARDFLLSLAGRDDITTVLFDPPYSPRQISECYASAGLTATMKDTQNARFYKECREAMMTFLRPGAVVLSFGWNSVGMGAGWERLDTRLVYHGGAHNDTICCADRKPSPNTPSKAPGLTVGVAK
jgi:hypothetical protein